MLPKIPNTSWYKAFLKQPQGTIRAAKQEIAVRAVHIKDKRLRDDIARVTLETYSTPGALKYARDLGPKSRATTFELVAMS